jgi:hypothetical protein
VNYKSFITGLFPSKGAPQSSAPAPQQSNTAMFSPTLVSFGSSSIGMGSYGTFGSSFMPFEQVVGNDVILTQWPELKILTSLLVNNEAFVAGGFFKDVFSGKEAKDIDVFFNSEDAEIKAVEKFRKSSVYEEEYTSPKSVGFRHKPSGVLVDLITYRYGTPQEIIDSFDFTVCKFVYALVNNEYVIYHHQHYFIHLDNKDLVVAQDSRKINPDLLFNRIIRYTQYGFNLDTSSKSMLFEVIKDQNPLTVTSIKRQY